MSETFEISLCSLGKLLDGRYFVIPPYQRHYAWGKQQCNDLFDDIASLDMNGTQRRFMGYITAQQVDDLRRLGGQPMEVVDGQQRLTSLVLLLAAIRSQTNGVLSLDVLRRGASCALIVQDFQLGGAPVQLQSRFENLVFGSPTAVANAVQGNITPMRRINDAYEVFRSRLADFTPDQLIKMSNIILDRLDFVLNSVSNVAQAADLFEGLNNRGKKLSQLEKLKTYSIYVLHRLMSDGRQVEINGQTFNQAAMVGRFNSAISHIYHQFEEFKLRDEKIESNFLVACWCLVWGIMASTNLLEADANGAGPVLPPFNFDPAEPVNDYRRSLSLKATLAHQDDPQFPNIAAQLIIGIDKVLQKLKQASRWYAELRRPPTNVNDIDVVGQELIRAREIHALAQRLGFLRLTDMYALLVFAVRSCDTGYSQEFLRLMRLLERTGFVLYFLFVKRRSFGLRFPARLARLAILQQRTLPQVRSDIAKIFHEDGVYVGDENYPDENMLAASCPSGRPNDDENEAFENTLEQEFNSIGIEHNAAICSIYEWKKYAEILAEDVSLQRFNRSIREHGFRTVVPRIANNQALPVGFNNHNQAIINALSKDLSGAFAQLEFWTDDGDLVNINEFNAMPWAQKRQFFLEHGIPESAIPGAHWGQNWHMGKRAEMTEFFVERWSIPQNGLVTNDNAARLLAAPELEIIDHYLLGEEPPELDDAS